jgi:DHA1 family multidrug resistance protein-like MFS transporter
MTAHSMDKRQLLAICLCFSLISFEATSTVGVMPVYVVQLGADAAATGLYLAFNFFGVTVGNIIGGWLSDRFGQRKRIALSSIFFWIPAALLIGRATSVTGVILTTGLMWVPGGIAVATLNSILGLSAGAKERGRVFGWVALASGIGALIAGLAGGGIAERWGFPALFVAMAVAAGVMLVIATTIRDVAADTTPRPQNTPTAPAVTKAGLGMTIYMLLLANLFARLGPTVSDLGRPLVMLQLKMDTTDISSAIAFSSAATLPLPLILGWLSDRIGRKRLLILFYALGAVGILLLSIASASWHFWLSAALVAVINASNGVGQAYIADLSNPKTIGQSLSLFTSSGFIASMIGLGGAGYVMQGIGINTTLLLGAASLVIAMVVLLRMRPAASVSNLQTIEVSTP